MTQARAGRRFRDWLGPAAALAFVAAAAFFWGGHVLDEEAVGFLRKYWGERPALQTVLDVRGWDFYQGRELSYAIDYLDAQWVRLLMSHDVLFFVPPSAVLSALAIVAIGWRLAPRALPRLDAATRWLGILLLLSNFVFLSTTGLLYRATKPVVAPLLLGLLLFVLAEHRDPRFGPRAGFWAALLTALGMSLLDRQGLFYVLALVLVLSVAWLRTRRGAPLLLGAATAVMIWYVYFRAIGPWIIHATNGYWPQTRFQQLRAARLMRAEPWLQGADILGSWTSVLFGGLRPVVLLALALAGGAVWAWSERRRPGRIAVAAGVAVAASIGQLAMVAIMVDHHPPVAWLSHRLWYYPLPYQTLVAFALLWGLERLSCRRGAPLPLAVVATLAGFVVLNAAQWPENRVSLDSDPPFSDQLRRSALLVQALRNGHAGPLLDGDHRRFYFECLDLFPRFTARSRPQVGEGEGIRFSEISDGRVVAWAERRAQIVARTSVRGRYVLAGRARLRAGDSLQILLGSPPRLVAEVSRAQPTEGVEAFRVTLELGAGANDVRLLSRLPEIRIPGAPRRAWAAYVLELPVLLWPEPRPSA